MSIWELPVSLCVGGKDYPIRYQFGAILDILRAYNDPDLDESEQAEVMLSILFPDFEKIPESSIPEALEKAKSFIDCDQKEDGKPKPKLFDWEQDAPIIIPEINKIAGKEIRWEKDTHWWTFYGWFMSIGEGYFANVLHIRQKKANHKKLEKWEQEFYKNNKSTIDLKKPESVAERAIKDSILSWL